MNGQGQPGRGWTVVLRRRPVRMVEGRSEGGYTDEFEIVCCECGDSPDLDYREVAPELQRIRGPYPMPAGITAYVKHARRHPGPRGIDRPGRRRGVMMAAADGLGMTRPGAPGPGCGHVYTR